MVNDVGAGEGQTGGSFATADSVVESVEVDIVGSAADSVHKILLAR